MEFSIWCPTDGTVKVGLEDVRSIVVKSRDDVQVMFACPRCGASISMTARIPHALLASLDEGWLKVDDEHERYIVLRRDSDAEETEDSGDQVVEVLEQLETGAGQSGHIESYCEYFRRELEHVETAEQLLAEIDQA